MRSKLEVEVRKRYGIGKLSERWCPDCIYHSEQWKNMNLEDIASFDVELGGAKDAAHEGSCRRLRKDWYRSSLCRTHLSCHREIASGVHAVRCMTQHAS